MHSAFGDFGEEVGRQVHEPGRDVHVAMAAEVFPTAFGFEVAAMRSVHVFAGDDFFEASVQGLGLFRQTSLNLPGGAFTGGGDPAAELLKLLFEFAHFAFVCWGAVAYILPFGGRSLGIMSLYVGKAESEAAGDEGSGCGGAASVVFAIDSELLRGSRDVGGGGSGAGGDISDSFDVHRSESHT